MATQASATALDSVLGRFEQRRPLRAGSLIVTVFGDAIVPRGGTLWLGSLLEIMALFGIEAGLVRTALSRLVQEDWFERSRAGKNSFYRLSPDGVAKFAEATHRIYHAQEPAWDGGLRLAVLSALNARERTEARDRLLALGFGQSAPTVMLRPMTSDAAHEPALPGVVWLTARLDDEAGAARTLAETAWQLDTVAQAYARFIEMFQPLADRTGPGGWDPAHAFRLRILLIHEYRRIILRDPLLPRVMLPASWPGLEARRLCRRLYRTTLAPAEQWLDMHAQARSGPLPAPDKALKLRFGAP